MAIQVNADDGSPNAPGTSMFHDTVVGVAVV
jgi:hypothetical protein